MYVRWWSWNFQCVDIEDFGVEDFNLRYACFKLHYERVGVLVYDKGLSSIDIIGDVFKYCLRGDCVVQFADECVQLDSAKCF